MPQPDHVGGHWVDIVLLGAYENVSDVGWMWMNHKFSYDELGTLVTSFWFSI